MADVKPIKALAASMAVVDALAERGDLSPAELAHITGLPRPSVYRFIDGLRAVGLVQTTAESRAQLSVKWLHLADAARAAMTEWAAARDVLDGLAADTEQTAFLTVPRRDETVCVDWAQGSGVGVLFLSPGGALPLYAGGAGRLTLAYGFDVDEYASTGPERVPLTPHTLTDADALRADVRRTRAQGYTLSLDDATVGIGAVAVPVTAGDGSLRGCVSLAGRSTYIRDHVDTLVDAATAGALALARAAEA